MPARTCGTRSGWVPQLVSVYASINRKKNESIIDVTEPPRQIGCIPSTARSG